MFHLLWVAEDRTSEHPGYTDELRSQRRGLTEGVL
jgi:hypothetical protein